MIAASCFLEERVGPVRRRAVETRDVLPGVLLHSATSPDAWTRWAVLTGSAPTPKRAITFEHFYVSLQRRDCHRSHRFGRRRPGPGSAGGPYGLFPDGSSYVLMAPAAPGEPSLFDITLAWLRAECTKLDAWAG